MKEWWHVVGSPVYQSEDVLAATAEMAALAWCDDKTPDRDSLTVTVTSIDRPADEPPRRFTLTSRTTWTAKETK